MTRATEALVSLDSTFQSAELYYSNIAAWKSVFKSSCYCFVTFLSDAFIVMIHPISIVTAHTIDTLFIFPVVSMFHSVGTKLYRHSFAVLLAPC